MKPLPRPSPSPKSPATKNLNFLDIKFTHHIVIYSQPLGCLLPSFLRSQDPLFPSFLVILLSSVVSPISFPHPYTYKVQWGRSLLYVIHASSIYLSLFLLRPSFSFLPVDNKNITKYPKKKEYHHHLLPLIVRLCIDHSLQRKRDKIARLLPLVPPYVQHLEECKKPRI